MQYCSPIALPEAERQTLQDLCARHPKPYVRIRAAAILKMADGLTAKEIAATHLLKVRDPEALGEWRRRYLASGFLGLFIRPGRGRKPAFSPSVSRRRQR